MKYIRDTSCLKSNPGLSPTHAGAPGSASGLKHVVYLLDNYVLGDRITKNG